MEYEKTFKNKTIVVNSKKLNKYNLLISDKRLMKNKLPKPVDILDQDLHMDDEDFETLGVTVGHPYKSWHDMEEEDLPLPEYYDEDIEEELEFWGIIYNDKSK